MTVHSELDFIERIESLPPLPGIANRIQALTTAPNASAEHVAKALRGDPAIASKILRVANSPFYGAGGRITQVSRAVVMLGTRAIRNLVLAICTRSSLIPTTGQASEQISLWTHSIAVAATCDMIARKVGFNPPEEAFLAGLLHDAGKLAMAAFDPEFTHDLLQQRPAEKKRLEMEQEQFGMDHTEAGFRILTRWGLPESFRQAAKNHHEPEIDIDSDSDRLVAIIMIANSLVQIMGFGPDMPVGNCPRALTEAQRLGVSPADTAGLLAGLGQRAGEAIKALAGTGGADSGAPALSGPLDIVWVSADEEDAPNICRSLLECMGCAVRRVAPAQCDTDPAPEETVLIDQAPGDDGVAEKTARRLAGLGHQRIVMLCESPDGGPLREYDSDAGQFYIPREFTAFDLQWLDKQWRP